MNRDLGLYAAIKLLMDLSLVLSTQPRQDGAQKPEAPMML